MPPDPSSLPSAIGSGESDAPLPLPPGRSDASDDSATGQAEGASARRSAAARAAVALLLGRLRRRQRLTLGVAVLTLTATLGGTAWALLSPGPEIAHTSAPDASAKGPVLEASGPSGPSADARAADSGAEDLHPAAPIAPGTTRVDAEPPAVTDARVALALPEATRASHAASEAPPLAATSTGTPDLAARPGLARSETPDASPGTPTRSPTAISGTRGPAPGDRVPSAPVTTHPGVGSTAASVSPRAAVPASPFRPAPATGDTGGAAGLCDIQPGPEAGRQMRRCIEAYSRLDRAGL